MTKRFSYVCNHCLDHNVILFDSESSLMTHMKEKHRPVFLQYKQEEESRRHQYTSDRNVPNTDMSRNQ